MEHRWGQRVVVDLPVRVSVQAFSMRAGRLCDISVSGAFIKIDTDIRPLSRIQVVIDLPHRSKQDSVTVAAYVARKLKDGIGVEWCEYSPAAISRLVKAQAARRHTRLIVSEPRPETGTARRSPDLLKHGT